MAAFPQTITNQNPVDLGGGFEDPMDPCTMCMQGQQEIQQAYNELTQSCNACQTQHNLQQLQQQGCQGCAQAQQVIQKVQQQGQGCASCGAQQPMLFQQTTPQMQPQQGVVFTGSSTSPLQYGQTLTTPQMTSQGLVQPMLTPLTGTSQQGMILPTVTQQPGMMADHLPIAIERGPTTQAMLMTTQPMVTGMITQPVTTQPTVTGMIMQPAAPVQQPVVTPMITPSPAPVMQPVITPTPAPPPPAPAQPVMQPAPAIQTPQLTPAQIAGAQSYVQGLPNVPAPQISVGGQLPIQGGLGGGYAVGGGKAGPGAAGGPFFTKEGQLGGYAFNVTAGPGIGVTGIGGPGAFDVHRPDLHAGGGWHLVMPMGTDAIFNLL